MKNFNIYYHIVPLDDGCVFLCQDRNTGELYRYKKADDWNPEALIFSSEQAAEEWIELTRLPKGRFKAQWFAIVGTIEKFDDVRYEI